MAELTTENFHTEFARRLTLYVEQARRKSDAANAAIREAYGPIYADFFPLDSLRTLPLADDKKNTILNGLYKRFAENGEGDFAYAMLEASREMKAAGTEFDKPYCNKLELLVADTWRKMGAQAAKNSMSAAILIDEKCTQSHDAIKALSLNEGRMVALANDPVKLHSAASVLFPELANAMDKMAEVSGAPPITAVGERIRKGLLLPAGECVIRS